MKRYVIFILLAALPLLSQAEGGHGDKKDKTRCDRQENRKSPRIHSVEEFGFMVPPPSTNDKCNFKKRYQRAIVNFYQWYLNNQNIIIAGLSEGDNQKDLLPPFHVSYKSLHRFYELIRKKYPTWVSELTPETPPETLPLPVDAAPPELKSDLKSGTKTTQCDLTTVADTLSSI